MPDTILPASGHNLWIAFFDQEDVVDLPDDVTVADFVHIAPIIGWVVPADTLKPGDDRPSPMPLTPTGVVRVGTIRYTGVDADDVVKKGVNMATEYAERKNQRRRS